MAEWHRTWRGDIGLRVAGLGAGALAGAAVAQVVRLQAGAPAHWTPGPVAFLLATAAFLLGSAGVALVTMGSHLFDKVVVSERWRTGSRAVSRAGAAAGQVVCAP